MLTSIDSRDLESITGGLTFSKKMSNAINYAEQTLGGTFSGGFGFPRGGLNPIVRYENPGHLGNGGWSVAVHNNAETMQVIENRRGRPLLIKGR